MHGFGFRVATGIVHFFDERQRQRQSGWSDGKEGLAGLSQFDGPFRIGGTFGQFHDATERAAAARFIKAAVFVQQVVDGRIQRRFAEETRVSRAADRWLAHLVDVSLVFDGERTQSAARTQDSRVAQSRTEYGRLGLFYGTRTLRLAQLVARLRLNPIKTKTKTILDRSEDKQKCPNSLFHQTSNVEMNIVITFIL